MSAEIIGRKILDMNQAESPDWRNLVAACAAVTVFGLTFGMTYPLLSLLLEERGVSPSMIGMNSAMMPIGILLFSSVIPLASRRFGSRNTALTAALITAFLMPCFMLFDSLEAWFGLRLLTGMSTSILFVLSEAWIVRFAGDKHRGKIVALYGSILSASFGAGPALISWIGIHGWLPYIIATVVLLLGMIPLSMIRDNSKLQYEETETSGIFSFMVKAPMLLCAVGVFSIFDASTLSLFPIYGLRVGLDVTTASLALTALILGNVFFQVPIGWLADIFPKRLVIASCALVAVISAIILPMVMATPAMWVCLVILGTSGYGVYSVALAALGDRFRGPELVTGSAAFAVMWGMGALFGSVSGGWAMAISFHGLAYLIAIVYTVLVVGLIIRGIHLRNRNG